MFGTKTFLAAAAVAILVLAGASEAVMAAAKVKRTAHFNVKIENISGAEGVSDGKGKTYPFVLSPGLFVVNHKRHFFFSDGKKANAALEAQAEDGNPEMFYRSLLTRVGGVYLGVFNTPNGQGMPGPLLPGQSYEFTFRATEGMRLNLIAMYGQSNDLFYAPAEAVDLFDANGTPLAGDITGKLQLWDAGTEVNETPGIGGNQAPRQGKPNTGPAEGGRVRSVRDGFTYPETGKVLRVTLSVN